MSKSTVINLPKFEIEHSEIILVGDSPLICHKWSEKQKKQILDKQTKKASTGKEARDIHQEYIDSLYQLDDGRYGFPVIAFKAAAVRAAKTLGMHMTDARSAFHVNSGLFDANGTELVVVYGDPSMREDNVKIGMGTGDLRYRGQFKEWAVKIGIKHMPHAFSLEQIISLIRIAGFAVGVGEWRPERDGAYGMFHIASSEDDAVLKKLGVV